MRFLNSIKYLGGQVHCWTYRVLYKIWFAIHCPMAGSFWARHNPEKYFDPDYNFGALQCCRFTGQYMSCMEDRYFWIYLPFNFRLMLNNGRIWIRHLEREF